MPYKDPDYQKKYYLRNRAKKLARSRAWKLANPARKQANDQASSKRSWQALLAYEANHPEAREERLAKKRSAQNALNALQRAEECARVKAYRLAHPDEERARGKAYRLAHPEQASAHNRRYTARHPERIRLRVRKFRQEHPEFVAMHNARRRARKANAPSNTLTHAEWVGIQEAQDHRCYYCGKRCKGRLTQDHILPLSQGGSHTLHNVIGACGSCNSRKGTKPPPIPVQPFLLVLTPSTKKAS